MSTASIPDDAARDLAIKKRIMKHMNTEHQHELSLYLQHFCSVPASAATSPTLTDMTYDSFIITAPSSSSSSSSSTTIYTVPVKPPMTSWSDVRPRAVAMDAEARISLGLPEIMVTEYVPPSSTDLVVVEVILLLWSGSVLDKLGYFVPGTWFYDSVLSWVPGGPQLYLKLQFYAAVIILALHVPESIFMIFKLDKYGVERFGSVWWRWLASNFFEGIGAQFRFNALVEKKRKQLDSAKKEH